MTVPQLIEKYTERIMVDYPEADKIHIEQISMADDIMITNPNAAKQYRDIVREVLEQLEEPTGEQELIEEAKELVLKLLPADNFGEDYDAERLYEILETLGQH